MGLVIQPGPIATATPGESPRPTRVAQDAHDILVWRFDQASGNEPNVGSGAACDGIPCDSGSGADLPIRQVPGRFGYCARLCRSYQRFSSTLTPAVALPTGDFSAHIWFKLECYTTGGWMQLFQKNWSAVGGVGSPYGAPKLAITSDCKLDGGFIRKTATAVSMLGGWGNLGFIGPGCWHHGALTYVESTLEVCAYLDGALIASETLAFEHDAPAGPWAVGGWGSASTNEPFVGLVEDFRVCDVARDAAYFRTLWSLGMPADSAEVAA